MFVLNANIVQYNKPLPFSFSSTLKLLSYGTGAFQILARFDFSRFVSGPITHEDSN